MTDNHDRLAGKIRTALQDSSETLDAATQSRITEARYRALQRLHEKERFSWWAPAAMVATACVALIVITLLTRTTPEQETLLDDMDMITTVDDLEFYEDLEFYQWLEEHELPT